MQKLLDKLARLKRRIMNAENRTKRVLIAGKIHIVNEEGKFASNLKQKWAIK